MRRAATRALALALILSGVALAAPGRASAHALVRRSSPPDGAMLDAAPRRVVVTFTEQPDPGLSFLRVLDESGSNVETGPTQAVPGSKLDLAVGLPPSLPDGVYTVTWRAISRVDGPLTAGAFSFGVGVRPEAGSGAGTVAPPTTPSPPPLAVAGRWAFYWGLAILLGGAAAGLLWNRGTGLDTAGAASRLAVLAWLAAAAGLVLMIVAERAAVGVPIVAFLSSATGHEFVRRAVAVAVVGGAVALAAARPGRLSLAVLGTATAGAMLVHAMAGHAAASGGFAPLNETVQWAHLLGVGAWIGGLPWLLLGLRPSSGEERAGLVRRYSAMAGVALTLVLLTGLSRLLDEVGWPQHWGRLLDTSFGLSLLAKIVLVGALVALGARNRYRNVGRAAEGRTLALARTVRLELAVAAAVLAATALMSELPPSATLASAAPRPTAPASVVVSGSDAATTVRARLQATPGTVGPNRFEVRLTDYDTGRPVPATAVSLSFSLPGRPDLGSQRLDLSSAGAGVWSGRGTVLSMDGRWSVTVTVQQPATGVEVPLELQTRLPPQRVTVSRASGQPTLYTIALAGGASLQAYVDPGTAGPNAVHFTFFRASGDEQPIERATATATPPAGATADLTLIRFDPGHFVANARLTAGRWRFSIRAVTADGTVFNAYLDQQIPS